MEEFPFLKNLALVGQALSGFLTPFILLIASIVALKAKRADILMESHRRFGDLMAKAPGIEQEEEALRYYERFWSLQLDQFNFWVQGYVDDTTFKFWMRARKGEHAADGAVGPVSYQKGWGYVKQQWGGNEENRFMIFMDQVFSCSLKWDLPTIKGGRTPAQWLTRLVIGE